MAAGRPKKPDRGAGARAGRERELAGIRGFAPGAPLAELPATARRILEAARRILERDGFADLTYEAIAAESGEYKDSVRYHFGGKGGLVAAIVDSSVHDASLTIFAEARRLDDPRERVAAVVGASRELPGAEDAWLMWELLPHVTRDRDLRTRVADLYEWYREHYLEVFSAVAGDEPPAGFMPASLAHDYASIMLAVLDGLAMQKALDPDGVDLDAVFELWQRIVTASLGPLAAEAPAG
ncbi:MAG TPA: TetR/AcrR family transcriptional regulator [Thermoleophilia bacterium]|nr:TetR/AcrR family transcriptional regulator [Thermoleophilia bacterium]